ncbi:pectate lyase [Brenneria roseae subsp. americana]|uniref:pectate lyase n=1 Tax=Brenneria roseae subsp. americana TaxID=1508507 RepID=A0A2U1TTW9_9GAMM|nr:pectate lyase [Brenneria roseae]PWC12792.1 pectate lyase [Brenneria roseae subsp. americana]
MAEINTSFNVPSGVGFPPAGSDSTFGGGDAASSRSPQQERQLLEALGTLLTALLPNLLENGQSSSDSSPLSQASGQGNQGAGAAGQNGNPADILMKLLEALIPGSNTQGAGNQSGATGSNNGASPLSGASGSNGTQNPENLGRSLLQDSISNALNNAINPTADGGGELSDNMLLKALMELIANLMDAQKGEFGQPQNSTSSPANTASPGSSGSGGGSVPSTATGQSATPSASANPSASSGIPASPSNIPLTGASAEAGKTGAVTFPAAGKDVTTVNETIKVGPGEVFDGGGKTFVAGSALGDGSQAEGQKPIFELAQGATLKNVVFGDNAADGVHVRGDAKIDNVHWTNVGEDALTVKSNNGKPANVEITNSSAQGASDKIFQLNADANLTIDNFKAKDFGTFVRTNGGQQGNWNLNLSNIDAENGKFSFVKSDSEGLNVKGSNLNLVNVNNHYKVPDSANLQVN